MNFYSGLRGNFAFSPSVYDYEYLSTQTPNKYLKEFAINLYPYRTSSNDLNDLERCSDDARATNDFYNGGRLEYYMNHWYNNIKQAREDLSYLEQSISAINAAITQYNDELQKAKREYCAYEMRRACTEFNYSYHVKKEWTETKKVGNTTYTYYYTDYWEIKDYSNLRGDKLEQLASKIEIMEDKSGIKFMNPRDWRDKVKRGPNT